MNCSVKRKRTMQFNKTIKIGDFIISQSTKAFVIAEAGVNHNGDLDMAKQLIDCAVGAGADAVKFQAFKAEHLILKNVDKAAYQLKTTAVKESQFDMLKGLELTKEQNIELKVYCQKKGIIFLTTPFDDYSLEELDELDLPAYKIASTDITNPLFLKKIAKKGKPIILSTGMAYFSEVKMALKEIYPFNKDVILLQCTANYPINDEEANLGAINAYKEKFNILIGYSDHSVGIGAAPYAVAMGAKVVEKHFTLDKSLQGPDHKASLSPEELRQFVAEIKKAEKFLGSDIKAPTISEFAIRRSLQKCLVAARPITKGEIFNENNITAKRTGGKGISPVYYKKIIGEMADKDYNQNEILKEE